MNSRTVIVMLTVALHFSLASQAEIYTISAASIKPYDGGAVTESNGCYKNVGYGGFSLPNDVFITAIDVSLFNEASTEKSQFISLNKHEGSNLPISIIGEARELPPGFSKIQLLATDNYVLKDKEFLTFYAGTSSADSIGLCGFSVHYEKDLIFISQFDQ